LTSLGKTPTLKCPIKQRFQSIQYTISLIFIITTTTTTTTRTTTTTTIIIIIIIIKSLFHNGNTL